MFPGDYEEKTHIVHIYPFRKCRGHCVQAINTVDILVTHDTIYVFSELQGSASENFQAYMRLKSLKQSHANKDFIVCINAKG